MGLLNRLATDVTHPFGLGNAPQPQGPVRTPAPVQRAASLQVVRTPAPQSLSAAPMQRAQPLQVRTAPAQSLRVGNQTVLPSPNAHTANPNRNDAALQALLHPSLAHQVVDQLHEKLTPALAAASQTKELAQQFVARPAAEAAGTLRMKQATYTPGSRIEKSIFGDTPVQNIQKNVGNNYATHDNLPTPLRVGLAAADLGGQILNVIPSVGAAGKGAKVAVKEAAPVVGKALADGAKLLPELKQLDEAGKIQLPSINLGKKGQAVKDTLSLTPRTTLQDQRALRDYSDHLVGVNKATGDELYNTINSAKAAAAKHGIDITSGSRAQQLENTNKILDTIGQKNKGIVQGGYVKKPDLSRADMLNNAMYESLGLPKHLPQDLRAGGTAEGLDYQTLRNKLVAAKSGLTKLNQSGKAIASADGSVIPTIRKAVGKSKVDAPTPTPQLPAEVKPATKPVGKVSDASLPDNTPGVTDELKDLLAEQPKKSLSGKAGVVDKKLRDLQDVHKQLVNAEAEAIRPIHQPTAALNPVAARVRAAGGISTSAYEDVPKGVIRKAGQSADRVAQQLGYNSEDELINALHTEIDAKSRTLTNAQLKAKAVENLQSGKSEYSGDYTHLQNLVKQRQDELSRYPTGARKLVKVTDKPAKISDAELQSLSQTPEGMAKKAGNKVTQLNEKRLIRNPEADREVQNVLKKGGTTDEALNAYMKHTGTDLQTAVKEVRRIASESNIGFNGGKNPLEGTIKLPEVPLGNKDAAFLNADGVKAHEQRIGQDALDAFNGLSEKDKTLLKSIETDTVSNVAKKAENPEAFTKAEKAIRTYYDTRHAYDHALGIDVGYRANYLRQIFAKAEERAKADMAEQTNIKAGNKRPGYTQSRSFDTLNTHVGDALTHDIQGSSSNHARLAYAEGLKQAFPEMTNDSGQLVRGQNGNFLQLDNRYGQGITADPSIAKQINRRTRPELPSGKLARYDSANAGLKQVKLGGGAFHALTEAGTFIGQQLGSGNLFTEPLASAKAIRSFFSPKFVNAEMNRYANNGVLDKAALSGLKIMKKDILADANVSVTNKVFKVTGIKALHDATFQRELPYLKLKTFEQKIKGLDVHKPEDLQAMRDIAKGINDEIGGLNRDIEGAITPATFQRTQRFLLATDFTEGKIRTIKNALTMGGEQGQLAREIVAGKAVVFAALTVAGGTAFGDYNGKSAKDKITAIAKSLIDPSFKAGRYSVALPNTYASEFVRPFEPLFKSKNGAGQNATTADRVKGFQKYGVNRLAAVPSEALQLISNKDASGNRIYGKDYKFKGGAPISPGKTALNVAGGFVPIPAAQGIGVATGKTAIAPAIANVAGLRVSNEDAYNAAKTAGSTPKTGNSALDKLLADKKAQSKSLKATLSPEDQKLSTLSKTDRKKLIDSGAYTQAKFDGLDNYVKNQKAKLGISQPSTKTDPYKAPDTEYKTQQAAYDKAIKNKTYKDDAQRIKAETLLAKAKVGSTFDKKIRDLYNDLSSQQLYDYVSTNPDGNAIVEKVLAYGDALKDAGVETKNKFRTSKGAVNLSSKASKAATSSSKSAATSIRKNLAAAGKAKNYYASGAKRAKTNTAFKLPGQKAAKATVKLTTYKTPKLVAVKKPKILRGVA